MTMSNLYAIGDMVLLKRAPDRSSVKAGAVLEVVEYVNDEDWIDQTRVELSYMGRAHLYEFEKVLQIPTTFTPSVGNPKYNREIKPGTFVDVYDVLYAFKVTDPCLQHLIKKALAAGQRGHKDARQDLVDIRDSAQRALDSHDLWETQE
jgi:hypothetical protein